MPLAIYIYIYIYNVNLRSPLTWKIIQKLQLKQEISKVCITIMKKIIEELTKQWEQEEQIGMKYNFLRISIESLHKYSTSFWNTIWYKNSSISRKFGNWDFIWHEFLTASNVISRLGKTEWRIWISSLISWNRSRVIFSRLACKVWRPDIRYALVYVSFK